MHINVDEIKKLRNEFESIYASIKGNYRGISNSVTEITNNVLSARLSNANANFTERLDVLFNKAETNIDGILNFIDTQIVKYESMNTQALTSLNSINNGIPSSISSLGAVGVAAGSVAASSLSQAPRAATLTSNIAPVSSTDKIVKPPSGLGSVHSYMSWQSVKDPTSPQYALRQSIVKANGNVVPFDENGFAKLGDRYIVATTETYGKVGDYIDVVQSDGHVISAVIGDIKNQSNEGYNKWGYMNGQCIVEFLVDGQSWNGTDKRVHVYHPEWNSTVTQVINRGNYYDYTKAVQK